MSPPPTYLIVGASRGIGRELLRQLLHTSCTVIATARNPPGVQRLHTSITTSTPTPAAHYHLLPCDVDSDASIATLAQHLAALALPSLDRVFLNAGILEYPTRIAETSSAALARHLRTNAVGPLLVAQALRRALPVVRTLVFISSDSGSAGAFRAEEDGFGAYAMSKAALNQGLRHLAAELPRLPAQRALTPAERTQVMAVHPGEVQTEMADVAVPWDVGATMTAAESVRAVLAVVERRGEEMRRALLEGRDEGVARFWDWSGEEHSW